MYYFFYPKIIIISVESHVKKKSFKNLRQSKLDQASLMYNEDTLNNLKLF